ncbi:MAG: hypothetical protein H0V17_12010 [Deltaproteobacteria bacterium]|nr:hypothetical protein [Deltaproteobacteria bacterium]
MSRLVSLLSVCVVASATVTVVVAQPKKPEPKKAPVAPAKDPPPAPAPAAGSGSADAPSPAAPVEEPPPKDIEGRDENPGAPGGITTPDEPVKITVPVKLKTSGYPIEEYLRPINLPANMSEVAIGPHAQLGAGDGAVYAGADALRARYGITREVQLGLTYVLGGVYDDPATPTDDKIGFHSGKAVGIDVTVLLANWIGIRVGVPVYIKPVAFSLSIGVPIKFQFGDKFALGGLDDLLNIKLSNFAPSFYQELTNAVNAELERTNGIRSAGQLRISGYGIYQHKPKTALIGRLGFNMEDFAATSTQSDAAGGGLTYFLRAGVQYSPRKFLDLGISLGFDDLAEIGTFGPAGFLAFRI